MQVIDRLDPHEIARCLFNETNDALLVVDPNNRRILDANPVALRLTKLRKRELTQMRLSDLLISDSENDEKALFTSFEETGFFHSREGYELKRDGEENIHVNVSVSRIHMSPSPMALVVIRDVDRRKRAEYALSESEERFRMLFDYAGFPILLVNSSGTIERINQTGAALLGSTSEEICGSNLANLLSPGVGQRFRERIQTVAQDGVFREFEETLRIAGENRWFLASFHRYPLAAGTVMGVQIILQDNTERRAAELRLHDANRKLSDTLAALHDSQQQVVQQERLSAIGQLASGIAHDLKNLLTPVVGNLDLVLNQNAIDREARELLDLAAISAADAVKVLARLKDYYRPPEEDAIRDILPLLDVVELAKQIPQLTRQKWKDEAQKHGRQIGFIVDPTRVPPIRARESEIRQLLTNLVFNAVDAMPAGGTIQLKLKTEQNKVVIELSDTGIGMDENTRQLCTDPFYTTSTSGSGLGLTICKTIVTSHGGQLEMESHPGEGTIVRIYFEPAHESQAPLPPPPKSLQIPLVAQSLLYIDDDPAVRPSIAALLKALRLDADVAGSGEVGLEMAAAKRYDLVLTDYGMPGMNGIEVAEKLKAMNPKMPVVLVTGWDEEELRENAADFVIQKPLTLARLREVLRSALPEKAER